MDSCSASRVRQKARIVVSIVMMKEFVESVQGQDKDAPTRRGGGVGQLESPPADECLRSNPPPHLHSPLTLLAYRLPLAVWRTPSDAQSLSKSEPFASSPDQS